MWKDVVYLDQQRQLQMSFFGNEFPAQVKDFQGQLQSDNTPAK